jgi:pimeloyl-ACP methyl ester carboxylesterase
MKVKVKVKAKAKAKAKAKIKAVIVATLAVATGLAIVWPAFAAVPPSVRPAVAPNPDALKVPALTWNPCHGSFQCATARVPLDYRHPDGAMISIAVVRHLATDPAHRLGSLFVNGGGPSAQIGGFVSAYNEIPATLRARYDIIDFDPRGFGASTAVQCFPNAAAENVLLAPLNGLLYPVGARQISLWEHTWAAFDARCASSADPVLYHDTTADVARDMDLLRRAVGDPVLNYLGLSYATGLGATYANLFPGKVGHMVLDGNLDPVAWTRDYDGLPTWLRTGQDEATAAVLRDLLDLCGQAPTAACAFSAGTPAATRAKFTILLARLHQHPVTIGTPPQTFTDVVVANSMPLPDVSAWQSAAALLQQLWEASTTAGSTSAVARAGTGVRHTALTGAAATYAGQEQAIAMQCADSPNPRSLAAYPAAARLAYNRSGLVGPGLAWLTESCAAWPRSAGQDRYTGPWNRPTVSTILIIGNTGDPSTPYQSSVAMSRDLARARLLTVRGYGHTEFHNPSTCVTNYEVRYLLTGHLPPQGTVCAQNTVPFPLSAK